MVLQLLTCNLRYSMIVFMSHVIDTRQCVQAIVIYMWRERENMAISTYTTARTKDIHGNVRRLFLFYESQVTLCWLLVILYPHMLIVASRKNSFASSSNSESKSKVQRKTLSSGQRALQLQLLLTANTLHTAYICCQ